MAALNQVARLAGDVFKANNATAPKELDVPVPPSTTVEPTTTGGEQPPGNEKQKAWLSGRNSIDADLNRALKGATRRHDKNPARFWPTRKERPKRTISSRPSKAWKV